MRHNAIYLCVKPNIPRIDMIIKIFAITGKKHEQMSPGFKSVVSPANRPRTQQPSAYGEQQWYRLPGWQSQVPRKVLLR